MARKRQAPTDVATLVTFQVLHCELDGGASLVDCVTMHDAEIGMYALPAASPVSLVAVDVCGRTKKVLQRWADQGSCVDAAFRVDADRPSVWLHGSDTTVVLALAGALA